MVDAVRPVSVRVRAKSMKKKVTGATPAKGIWLDDADGALIPKLDAQPVRSREAHRFEGDSGSPRPDRRRRRPSWFLVGLKGDGCKLYGLGSTFKPVEQPR